MSTTRGEIIPDSHLIPALEKTTVYIFNAQEIELLFDAIDGTPSIFS